MNLIKSKMKLFFLKYMDKIIYISLFIIIYFSFNQIDPSNEKLNRMVFYFLLNPLLSFMVVVLLFLIHGLFFFNSNDEMPIQLAHKKKEFFEYKGSVYFTIVNSHYNNQINIYKSVFFRYKNVGEIIDNDDLSRYQSDLKNELDSFITKDINKKLKKRKLKYKFKEYNNI